MVRLTSVYGSFRAHVLAARLESEGFDVELRGALDSPYAVTIGELARVDLYVPEAQARDASLVLLVDEVDEVLDLDRMPRRRRAARWVVATALVGMVTLLTVEVLS
jgi:hypothetical protein